MVGSVDVPFEPIFVMRNRGNGPVEPPEMLVRLFLEGVITWKGYRQAYLDSIKNQTSLTWMQQIATRAKDHEVVLVCYEKSPEHCHRRLLAQTMQDFYGVEYKGELKP